MKRRTFLRQTAFTATAAALSPVFRAGAAEEPLFRLSLAEWSLNKSIFGKAGDKLDHLDFAKTARELGFDAVEYVNQMFFDKATDQAYLAEMKKRADGEGVRSLLIMCDREGNLGDPDEGKRATAVENHLKWLDAAAGLGCHSIRVNAASAGTWDEQLKLAADGLRRLCEEGEKRKLNVIVENHGGLSSHGLWLSAVIKAVDHPRAGILPDFGNFYTDRDKGELYNPYKGMREFMPFAKAVSAKSFDWDTGAGEFVTEDTRENREISLDLLRMMQIVTEAGYRGYVGIEYEGHTHPEKEGILKTKQVLEAIREKLATAV